MDDKQYGALRQRMIAEVVAETVFLTPKLGKPALSARVVDVVGEVPRHEFIPVQLQQFSYVNQPLPIGCGKTISQPFIVALMTDLMDPQPEDLVLEVGAGAGYQAAVLSKLVKEVYSIEIIEELAIAAGRRLKRLGYSNVHVGLGNGYHGWPEHAPFDKIIVTAAPDLIPPPLIEQLKPGGRIVIPTGMPDDQQLIVAVKGKDGKMSMRNVLPVRFSELDPGKAVSSGTA
jgi:protein-L-isoaspartate(D-aspartate) O-methyltransferase